MHSYSFLRLPDSSFQGGKYGNQYNIPGEKAACQPAFALGWKPFLYGFSQKRFPNGEQFDI